MLPRLVPEISPLDAFCDGGAAGAAAAGIGDSRSWIDKLCPPFVKNLKLVVENVGTL